MKINIGTLLLLLLFGKIDYAQTPADTVEMENDFKKVMSFSLQPYLLFKTITRVTAVPIVQAEDTITLTGMFYKNQENLYYGNEQEEIYLQDSFMIQINQKRKSIWISKVDVTSKERMTVLPVSNSQLDKLFKEKYIVQRTKFNGLSKLNFKTRQSADSSATITTNIKLEYLEKDYLPVLLEIEIRMQQPMNDELWLQLQNENIAASTLVQTIANKKYLVRLQTISVSFSGISHVKESAGKMPSWKEVLDCGKTGQQFIAKEVYKDYEVTKTF